MTKKDENPKIKKDQVFFEFNSKVTIFFQNFSLSYINRQILTSWTRICHFILYQPTFSLGDFDLQIFFQTMCELLVYCNFEANDLLIWKGRLVKKMAYSCSARQDLSFDVCLPKFWKRIVTFELVKSLTLFYFWISSLFFDFPLFFVIAFLSVLINYIHSRFIPIRTTVTDTDVINYYTKVLPKNNIILNNINIKLSLIIV